MKKVLKLIILIICILSVALNIVLLVTNQNSNNTNEDNILIENYIKKILQEDPLIDESYDEEIKNSGGTTSELIDISNKYAELWKNEMESEYAQIIDLLDENNKNIFNKAQESWEICIDGHNQFIINSNIQIYGDGSYIGILEADLQYQKYRNRTNELRNIYELLDWSNLDS